MSRLPIFIAVVAATLFLLASLHHERDRLPESISKWAPYRKPRPTFYQIAAKYGTDKVLSHEYHHMYGKYFPALRDTRLKMLEIGLGCDMLYGPGKSYYTWLDYFPRVDLYYIEFDAACANKWAANTTGATIYAGDQSDPAFLEKFIRETTAGEAGSEYEDEEDPVSSVSSLSGSLFDVIIDDGGHTMHQQITSLTYLWPIVKPGGVYFCEDLQTSYMQQYGGGEEAKTTGKKSMMAMIQELLDDINVGPDTPPGRNYPWAEDMISVECMHEVCGFWKRGLDGGNGFE